MTVAAGTLAALAKAPGPERKALVSTAERRPEVGSLLARLEAYVPALRRYAVALLQDQRSADDLVHRCLVSALGRLPALGHDTELDVWLLPTMYRRLSAGTSRRHANNSDLPDTIQALGRLPLEQRSAIYLVSVEGLPYASVAEVQGLGFGGVVSLLTEARNTLRELTNGRTT